METSSQNSEHRVDIYEDAVDFLEDVYREVDHGVFRWAIWCKTFACESEHEALKELLIEMVKQEVETMFKCVDVNLAQRAGGVTHLNATARHDL